jgi:hypothetical protein
MSRSGLHGRSTTDDAFYEWLLSDHPDARAERDYRRDAYYESQRQNAAAVRAWVDKVNAQTDAPQTARDLADWMGPRADESALRAETEFAEPDDLYVARVRAEFETYMQVSGPPDAYDYRYPEHLTGPSAASYPPPPEPETGGIEPGS